MIRISRLVRAVLIVGVVAAITTAVVLATGGGGSSTPSCAATVDRLASAIGQPSTRTRGLNARVVQQSFRACEGPDAWRLRAQRDQVAATLGTILNDPSITTDVALDVLCAHFDPYGQTSTCRLRQAPGGAGLG